MESLIPIIVSTLTEIESGKSIRVALRNSISVHQLNREEESILYHLVFEIYRKLNVIDLYIKSSSSSFSLKKISSKNRALLRIATYLLKVEENTIEYVNNYLSSFYDTISNLSFMSLLNLIQDINNEQLYENRTDLASKLSIDFFTPTWIVRKFLIRWGEEFTDSLLSSSLESLPMFVRVNSFKSSLDEVLAVFDREQISFELVNEIKGLVKIIDSEKPLPRLKEFNEGRFVIQQKASAIVPLVLDPKKEERILDMCAAPGGKTAHIADIIGETENIDAVDINDERIRILRERLKLLGIESINVIQADGRTLSSKGYTEYDKILLDPPCSGSGTYSSRPENKWRIQQRDIKWYTNLQRDLLNEASKILKEKGIIVYSTCSLLPEENHHIISSFIEKNPNFSLIEASPMIGMPSQTLDRKAQELYPHLHDTEGFFIAKIRKNK